MKPISCSTKKSEKDDSHSSFCSFSKELRNSNEHLYHMQSGNGGKQKSLLQNYESFIPILTQNEFKSSHELIFCPKKV